MSQLGRFDNTFLTPLGLAAVGASVAVYREGATVNGNQSGTTPLTITVRHRGKIAAGDTVFINTTTGTTYSVDSVTATTVVVSGFVGTLNVSNGDRLTPANNLPTLYSDDQGGATTGNPLTTSSLGRAQCWITPAVYDFIVSGGGATTTAFVSQMSPVVYDGQFGTLFLRSASEDQNGPTDPTLYADVTRDMTTITSGKAYKGGEIVQRSTGTPAFSNTQLHGFHAINRYGASGSGGGTLTTGIALGAYSEYYGDLGNSNSYYGAECASTCYAGSSGTIGSMFGALCTGQVSETSTVSISTALRGVQGLARMTGTSSGTAVALVAVEGEASLRDTSSSVVTDGIGGRFFLAKDAGVTGSFATATGVKILSITQGATNNFGLRIGGASGGSNLNQSLRIDSGESHFIGPVTSPPVTFTDLDTTPTSAGSNVFVAANSGATSITDFDNESDGQRIDIIFTNANTTIVHGGPIKNRSGANINPGADTTRTYVSRAGVWYETS